MPSASRFETAADAPQLTTLAYGNPCISAMCVLQHRMREIALDTETTGISPQEGHRIIEIGAVEMVNHYRTGKVFHMYINPEREVSEGAFKVHGISTQFLQDKPVFRDVARQFLDFISDSKLVIHNAQFDMNFINHHLLNLGIQTIPTHEERVLCTLQYARKKYPGARNSLDALCMRFNIDLSAREKHGALLDAELLADVYAEMVGAGSTQRNMLFSAGKKQEESIVTVNIAQDNRVFREPRVFNLTEAEQIAHDAFISTLKDPIWKKVV